MRRPVCFFVVLFTAAVWASVLLTPPKPSIGEKAEGRYVTLRGVVEEKEYAASHDDETARAIKSENGHPSEAAEHSGERYINGRRAVVQSEYAEMEIVNLDTIGSARREAANISSFDQFEEDKAKEMENNRVVKVEEEKPGEVPVETEPAPEEPTEEEVPEEKPEEEPKEPVDPNDDGFLDDPKDKEKEE